MAIGILLMCGFKILEIKMSRSSLMSSSCNGQQSRRLRNEDNHLHGIRSKDEDRRRQAWLIQQERERKHERLKQNMILEYELKRAAILRSIKEHPGRSSQRSRSRSKSRDHRSKKVHKPVIIMSEK